LLDDAVGLINAQLACLAEVCDALCLALGIDEGETAIEPSLCQTLFK
jgi:hypothetical protein